MDTSSPKTPNDEINVERIMEKIRENIRRRQASGEMIREPDSEITNEMGDAVQRDLAYINSNWDIHNNSYFISSHHPYLGKFLVKGRQVVHGEVRRYIDPMISRQCEVNSSIVRILNDTGKKINEFENESANQKEQFIQLKTEIDRIQEYVDKMISEIKIGIEERNKENIILQQSFLDTMREYQSRNDSIIKNLQEKLKTESKKM